MAIYGEVLLHFAEQYVKVPYFDMVPLIGDNYGPRIYETISTGIMQTSGSEVADRNDNLVTERNYQWWTPSGLIPGRFIEWQGSVYRLKKDSDWPREGGQFIYGLEKLVGSNGTDTDSPTWNTGTDFFG